MLISQPPHTTQERATAALKATLATRRRVRFLWAEKMAKMGELFTPIYGNLNRDIYIYNTYIYI